MTFSSLDPYMSINRYYFGKGDPINQIDLDGKSPIE